MGSFSYPSSNRLSPRGTILSGIGVVGGLTISVDTLSDISIYHQSFRSSDNSFRSPDFYKVGRFFLDEVIICIENYVEITLLITVDC